MPNNQSKNAGPPHTFTREERARGGKHTGLHTLPTVTAEVLVNRAFRELYAVLRGTKHGKVVSKEQMAAIRIVCQSLAPRAQLPQARHQKRDKLLDALQGVTPQGAGAASASDMASNVLGEHAQGHPGEANGPSHAGEQSEGHSGSTGSTGSTGTVSGGIEAATDGGMGPLDFPSHP